MVFSDLGIKDGEISKIGDLHEEKSEREINAEGKIVCPGFIDVNNHSDTFWQIFSNPDLESLVYQGITTIVGGNCGSSLAPLVSAKTIESIQKWIDIEKVNINWLSLKEFFRLLENKKMAVNFATLVGHATLRRGILEDQSRCPNPKELDFIRRLLKESLKEGALGMSSGLVYTHARSTPIDELIDLAKTIEKKDGIYATHIKDEGDELTESIEEAIRIAEETGVKLHISHLKAVGKRNWDKIDEVLGIIDSVSKKGLRISFDVYPYTNTGSVLYTLLPSWATEGGRKVMLHRLSDPMVRAKVAEEMKKFAYEYEKVEIASCPMDKTMTHRKITEIAEAQNKDVTDAILDILVASSGRVITSMEILNEKDVRKIIKHPLSMIATNGAGYDLKHAETGEMVHPRSFGTFIKVLSEYVLKNRLLSFEKAIQKMTGYPAERFGLKKRGRIKKGFFADVLVLDQNKISSPSSKANPYQYSRGIEYSIVNGKIVIDGGTYSGRKNGKIIKR